MNIRFDGKVVAVSGAARGFGRHIAWRFAELGAAVHGCDIAREGLAETARRGIITRYVDLTDRALATEWIREVESGSAIDILVNNAGGIAGARARAIEGVSDSEWDELIDINAGACFALSRAAAPAMKRERRGRIVNIASGAGVRSSRTGIHAYVAAKHAVVGLTRQLASELGPFGITVNGVAPGFVRSTAETEQHWQDLGAEGQKSLVASIALRRLGTPEDVGNAVLFLASEHASWITGQVLLVDGGV